MHAKPLVQLLGLGGREVFWDQQSIAPGDDWAKRLKDAVRSADEVVVLWCCHAARSEWVAQELAWATDADVRLVPVLLCKASAPDSVRRIQWIDMSGSMAHACELHRELRLEDVKPDPQIGNIASAPEPGLASPILDHELERLTGGPDRRVRSRASLVWRGGGMLGALILIGGLALTAVEAPHGRPIDPGTVTVIPKDTALRSDTVPVNVQPPDSLGEIVKPASRSIGLEIAAVGFVAWLLVAAWWLMRRVGAAFARYYRARRRRATLKSLPDSAKRLGYAVLHALDEPPTRDTVSEAPARHSPFDDRQAADRRG